MQPLVNIAIAAARKAGDIILRSADKIEKIKVNTKHGHEYFSEIDVKAEQAIIQTILKAYPDHSILAEESGTHEGSSEVTWIIDPIDGTNNYLHGFPYYCVSIAIKIKGIIEHGVIYDPIRHECFHASRGRGAKLDSTRIRVSKSTQLQGTLLGTGFSFKTTTAIQEYFPVLESLITERANIRKNGAAALDLAYVAAGRLDGFWKLNTRPWDIAAGCLMVREAGGFVSDFNGGESYLQNGNIVAGTPKIFKLLLQTIAKVKKLK